MSQADILNLVITFFLIILNILFFLKRMNFLMGLYLVVFSLMYIFPSLIELFSEYKHPTYVNSFHQNISLLYISAYHIIFIYSYIIFEKILKFNEIVFLKCNYNIIRNQTLFFLLLLFLFVFAVLAKFYLKDMEYWNFFINKHIFEFSNMLLLQLVKTISSYNLVVILIVSYYINKKLVNNYIIYLFYSILILCSLYFALQTGSRFQVIIIILVLIYIHIDFIKKQYFLMFSVSLLLVIMFKSSAIFRNSLIHDKEPLTYLEAVQSILSSNINIFSNLFDLMVTRFNYLDIVTRTIQMTYDKVDYTFIYYYNIIAIIPRIVWEDKPIIGLDWHEIGQNLLILGTHDNLTSVGLGIIGESYYELKLFGVFIAIFHSFLIYYINTKFSGRSLTGYVLYPLLSIYIVSKDSLIAVLPGLIYIILPIIFVLIIFENTQSFKKNNFL